MRVVLAGYNVDTAVIEELKSESKWREDITPEVFSASYARISRDPRPITEIRREARAEVERARKSNETIIFKMGHNSVAEHAVFNIDIIGVSRYAMEFIEHFRLASYTEKSQRHITLPDDYVIPDEVKEFGYEERFRELIDTQNAMYHKLYDKLREYVFEKNSELAKEPKNKSLLEGWAKEDARYITSLAVEAQVGMTLNARTLELMLRRFASTNLSEVKKLGIEIYERVKEIAPSILRYYKETDFDKLTYSDIDEYSENLSFEEAEDSSVPVKLLKNYSDGDEVVLAALLHTVSFASYEKIFEAVKSMSFDEKKELFKRAVRHMEFYDSVPREFEYVSLMYELVISASCFAQLKRHRMATVTVQAYDPLLGLTVPESIKDIGMEGEFVKVAKLSDGLFYEMLRKSPLAAPYFLTNAHRRRVLVEANLRELYHIARLREDAHAQWDIRNITGLMSSEARKVYPVLTLLLGGKDSFDSLYKNLFS